jgi:hypothetical protein
MLSRLRISLLAFLFLPLIAIAAEAPQQVVMWPVTGTWILKFSFGKFKSLGSNGSQRSYSTDVTAENLSSKLIALQRFTLYLFDKNKVRIGEAWMEVSNLGPAQTVKFQTTFSTSGNPVSLSVVSQSDIVKTISITVNSVPQGASVSVDGVDAGTTPKLINVGAGKHRLSFGKDGFKVGVFPLEIGPNDVSGGSVSYELSSASFDTIELRDGSVLNGDLNSVSGMDVVIRVGGVLQHIDRNKIKRILLTEREEPAQEPAPSQTNP